MLHSLAHFQPTVHGYSGIRPPFHDALYRALVSFPDAPSLDMLRAAGVRYVVVHPSRYAPGEWPNAEAQLDRWAAHLRLLHTESDGRVYELGPLVSEAPIR
jgi:hypothetical protein